MCSEAYYTGREFDTIRGEILTLHVVLEGREAEHKTERNKNKGRWKKGKVNSDKNKDRR